MTLPDDQAILTWNPAAERTFGFSAEEAIGLSLLGSVRRTASGEPSADTGLGLPFCKLTVECMGGRIELVGGSRTPTVFAITLAKDGRGSVA